MKHHSLSAITSLARSGALDRAWALFEGGGYIADASPAALAVKGRLLKDRAIRAGGGDRSALLAEAGAAYAAADAIAPAPYLLINIATLAALQGDRDRSAALAGAVIERLAAKDVAETPYYIAATRAEALLLMGDPAGAERALGAAIALHPQGWEEHACTLRQLSLILAARGEDAAWLDPHRPPASVHFAGHLAISEAATAGLRARVDAVLDEQRIGIAFGALAAGADIVIAEALLERGCDLHIVLPASAEAFAGYSVAPWGDAWLARYRACLDAAASVRVVAQADRTHEPLATALAAEVAMGAAMLHARRHETHATQILVIDEAAGRYGSGANTARDGMIWAETGAAQHIIRWPRDAPLPIGAAREEHRADRRLMALLLVAAGDGDIPGEDDFALRVDTVLVPLRRAIGAMARGPDQMLPWGNALLLAFDTAAQAGLCATALQALPPAVEHPLRIAGAYGIVHLIGSDVVGAPVALVGAVLGAVAPGTTIVTDLFASALALHCARYRTEWIGDHDLPGLAASAPLFALARRPEAQ